MKITILFKYGMNPRAIYGYADSWEDAETLERIARSQGWLEVRSIETRRDREPDFEGLDRPSISYVRPHKHVVVVTRGVEKGQVYAGTRDTLSANILTETARRYGYTDARVQDAKSFYQAASPECGSEAHSRRLAA